MGRVWLVGTALLVALALPALGTTVSDRCRATKLKATGKYDLCRLKAEAKAIQRGTSPDYSRCDSLLATRWQGAEERAGGECATTGDQSTMRAFLAQHADDVAAALAGGGFPTCSIDLATCTADLATALVCGNGAIDAGEECDQSNLDGSSCETLGFVGGALRCGNACVLDTSGCWNVRFVDNADGTITDRQTQLMWEKKVGRNGIADRAVLHDSDNSVAWAGACSLSDQRPCQPNAAAAAACESASQIETSACEECGASEGTCEVLSEIAVGTLWDWLVQLNASGFAGYSDWRVPTQRELLTIVDYDDPTPPMVDAAFDGADCGVACLDLSSPACSCSTWSEYWSGSLYPPDPKYVWTVSMYEGNVYVDHVLWYTPVRAVRGGT